MTGLFRLRTLGGVSIEGPDGPLAGSVAQRKRLALLTLLAGSASEQVSRDKLIALLWPDADTDQARAGLTDALYALRKTLGKDAIRSIGDDLRLEPSIVRSDVSEFRAAAAAGDGVAAAALYHGPFLDGFFVPGAPEFERWVESERAEISRQYVRVLEQLAESDESRGRVAEAVESWRRLAVHDPYNARIALRLMRALAAAGDRASAVRHAGVYAALLREELGVEPDPEVTAYAQRLQTGSEREADVPAYVSPSQHKPAREVVRTVEEESLTSSPVAVPATARAAAPARRTGRRQQLIVGGAVLFAALGFWGTRLVMGSEDAVTAPEIKSLAILPLTNLSSDPDQEFFSDGMTDAIITELARIGELRVISNTSVKRYKGVQKTVQEIARELGVDALVEGTVVRDGNRVRITAQLIAAATDAHLWAESYERDLRDILGLQRDVARAVASAVRRRTQTPLKQAASARDVDPTAYAFYLKALYLWNDDAFRNAKEVIDYLERVAKLEPTFAPAYAGLAEVYVHMDEWNQVPPSKRAARTLALENISRALELDESLAETHTSFAHLLMHEEEWAAAEREFLRAIELNPGYAYARLLYAFHLVALGRFDEAVTQARSAIELDPLSARSNSFVASTLYFARRYDAAIAQWRRTIDLYPAQPAPYAGAARTYLHNGMVSEGVALAEQGAKLTGVANLGLAYAYAAAGQRDRSRQVLSAAFKAAGEGIDPLAVAQIYSQLGERDEAFKWIERALQIDHGWTMFLQVEPAHDSLRADPRFDGLLRRMKLK